MLGHSENFLRDTSSVYVESSHRERLLIGARACAFAQELRAPARAKASGCRRENELGNRAGQGGELRVAPRARIGLRALRGRGSPAKGGEGYLCIYIGRSSPPRAVEGGAGARRIGVRVPQCGLRSQVHRPAETVELCPSAGPLYLPALFGPRHPEFVLGRPPDTGLH